MKAVQAHALYDYNGRNDKELSFKRGDIIQVIEKTPDHNWWDGFHDGKRGFIPVAYIEIPEFNSADPNSLPVPTPPQRRSSMPASDAGEHPPSPKKTIKVPQPSIPEDETMVDESVQIITPELIVQSPFETELSPAAGGAIHIHTPSVPIPTVQESVSEPSTPSIETKNQKEAEMHASVRSLSKQFQDPSQQKVLVEPHSTGAHRRQRSTDFAAQKGTEADDIPRSSSTGNKVGKMASVFESKSAPPPTAPLISPKPRVRPPAPGPPATGHTSSSDHQPPAFPLMSHPQPGGAAGISPLQRAAHQGQQKPVPADRKPAAPLKVGKEPKLRGVRREKSVKEKGKPTNAAEKGKPPTAAKPPGFGAPPGSKEFNAELAAKIARKQDPK